MKSNLDKIINELEKFSDTDIKTLAKKWNVSFVDKEKAINIIAYNILTNNFNKDVTLNSEKNISDKEKYLIKNYILKKDTISNYVYNNYLTRLRNIQKSLNKDSDKINNIKKEILDFENKTASISGIISLLEEELKINEDKINTSKGTNIAFLDSETLTLEEKGEINEFIDYLKKEISFLQKIMLEL